MEHYTPGPLRGSGVTEEIRHAPSVVRVIFELGREYERLCIEQEQAIARQ